MPTAQPRHLMNEEEMDQVIEAMAADVIESVGSIDDIVLVGIRTRGVPMAEWLAKKVEKLAKSPIKTGTLDINLYRDDLSEVDAQPVIKTTELPFPIGGKGIILVDDVLYTGRTIRAAMDALIDFGRPKFIRLAALVDRVGYRELPIQADYVGQAVDTESGENVKVRFKETDGANEVYVLRQS